MNAGLTHFLYRGSELEREEKAACSLYMRSSIVMYVRVYRHIKNSIMCVCTRTLAPALPQECQIDYKHCI